MVTVWLRGLRMRQNCRVLHMVVQSPQTFKTFSREVSDSLWGSVKLAAPLFSKESHLLSPLQQVRPSDMMCGTTGRWFCWTYGRQNQTVSNRQR